MSAPLLEVRALNAWYGAAQILFDLSFTIGTGEVVALMGEKIQLEAQASQAAAEPPAATAA